MSERILITGGTGYLGGRISQDLAKLTGYRVAVGHRGGDKKAESLPDPNLEAVSCDILDERSLSAACEKADVIIHLAALNEIDSRKSPERALEINGLGTLKVLQAAVRCRARRLIYFSTAHVYGSPLQGEITEETLARPSHPYAITHKTAEDFVYSHHKDGLLDCTIIRLSNGFGAPVHPDVNRWTLLANDLCRQAVLTKKLVLKSSGIQKRDFITLTDVCAVVRHFLKTGSHHGEYPVFNVGSGISQSVLDFTRLIASRCRALFGCEIEVERPLPGKDEKSPELRFDIEKLNKFGFVPVNNFNGEIDRTLLFCKENFEAGRT